MHAPIQFNFIVVLLLLLLSAAYQWHLVGGSGGGALQGGDHIRNRYHLWPQLRRIVHARITPPVCEDKYKCTCTCA